MNTADTTKHLSELRELPEGSNPNTLARVLVLKSISFYPQDPSAASLIIADELMGNFGKTNALSFSDVANMIPDDEWDADYVRDLHVQMGFSLEIETERVVGYMRTFAGTAVDNIKVATLEQAEIANIPIPNMLRKDIARYDFNTKKLLINQEVIDALQEFLSNPILTGLVRDKIHAAALPIRKLARQQRIRQVSMGRIKYPLHSSKI
jgi:hypothetical protein